MKPPRNMLLALWILGAGWTVRADDKPLYHFEIKTTSDAPTPIQFPFGLTGSEARADVVTALQQIPLDRGDFDTNFTEWAIPKKILYKKFHPSLMTLHYKDEKLMQVTLVQTDAAECGDILAAKEDAVDYVKAHYIFPANSVSPAEHFGSNNCVYYMKPGQSGWQAGEGDYLVNLDTNWRDMKYSGYMTFTYMPLYNAPASTTTITGGPHG